MNSIFLLVYLLLSYSGSQAELIDPDILILNVNIVNVENGNITPGRNVLISGNTIAAIYTKNPELADNTLIVNAKGKYLIPGLWDMHTHYNWNYRNSTPLLIYNGVTGIREMWGQMDTIQLIRQQVEQGSLLAPNVYSAGSIIDGTPPIWPGSSGVGNVQEALAEVEKQIEQGVDFIKVYSLLSREAYFAIARKCREEGIPFVGHVPASISIWEAIKAGQQSIEHLYGLLEACTSDQEKLRELDEKDRFGPAKANFLVESFNETIFDSLAVKLANSNSWVSPTLVVLRNISELDNMDKFKDEKLSYLPSYFKQMWDPRNDFRFKSRGLEYYEAAKRKYKFQLSLMGKLETAGVKFIAGTDFPNPFCYPGFSIHEELQLLVKGGLSNHSALKAATINAAKFMGKEKEFGKIEPGFIASLVLLNENPLDYISNTEKIEAVVLRGKYIDRKELDDLLPEFNE